MEGRGREGNGKCENAYVVIGWREGRRKKEGGESRRMEKVGLLLIRNHRS